MDVAACLPTRHVARLPASTLWVLTADNACATTLPLKLPRQNHCARVGMGNLPMPQHATLPVHLLATPTTPTTLYYLAAPLNHRLSPPPDLGHLLLLAGHAFPCSGTVFFSAAIPWTLGWAWRAAAALAASAWLRWFARYLCTPFHTTFSTLTPPARGTFPTPLPTAFTRLPHRCRLPLRARCGGGLVHRYAHCALQRPPRALADCNKQDSWSGSSW